MYRAITVAAVAALLIIGCEGAEGPTGATGPQGVPGEIGPEGPQGEPGESNRSLYLTPDLVPGSPNPVSYVFPEIDYGTNQIPSIEVYISLTGTMFWQIDGFGAWTPDQSCWTFTDGEIHLYNCGGYYAMFVFVV